MKNEKIILTDCDGVLLDWEKPFHEWMHFNGHRREVRGVYEMEIAYGISKSTAKTLIREFNSSAWIGSLPVFRDALAGVAKLVEAGYKFICITSLSLDEKARELRIRNLEEVFGKDVFLDVVCLDTGADKDEALEPYAGTGLYWLEDKTENAVCGAKLGLKSIVIGRPYNSDAKKFEGIERVASWDDIVDIIVNN